ncbi:MAG: hypothetical protein J7605_02665 [Variovorax sp.]|nr:hypothetical protein [Variovorax sp.]
MSEVHTSAPEASADLFGECQADQPKVDLVIEIQGVLTQPAEVRIKLVGEDKRSVPVLCLNIRPLSGIKRSIHVEQVFTEATRKVAEEKAVTLKRGARVVFRTGLTDMRVTFPHVRSITLHQEH